MCVCVCVSARACVQVLLESLSIFHPSITFAVCQRSCFFHDFCRMGITVPLGIVFFCFQKDPTSEQILTKSNFLYSGNIINLYYMVAITFSSIPIGVGRQFISTVVLVGITLEKY